MLILLANLSSLGEIIQFVLIFLLLVAVNILLFLILRRTLPKLFLVTLSLAIIAVSIFDLPYLFAILTFIYFSSALVFIYSNIADLRWALSNSSSSKDRKAKRTFRKIYDQDALINQLNAAVLNLSKTKMGALITIERSVSMNDYIRNGTMINAPVNAILLTSIFYKGTALHDGAVVIRDDTILAASVYFTPSTKALTGKVGSRHRAALGISDLTDSVTIVVSEETGRISFAFKGVLQPVNHDDFKKTLTEYLLEKN